MNDRLNDISIMKESWETRTPRALTNGGSAVLIPLIYDAEKNNWEILFERRALHLSVQPGDICLPGGKIEEGEEPKRTAVRETSEELVIPESHIELLGPMDEVLGPAQWIIHPYAGILNGYEGTFSEDEVHEVFTIPVGWFIENEPRLYQTTLANIPPDDFPYELIRGGRDYEFRKRKHDMYFYENGDRTIWGATAAVVRGFITLYKEVFSL